MKATERGFIKVGIGLLIFGSFVFIKSALVGNDVTFEMIFLPLAMAGVLIWVLRKDGRNENL